MHGTKKGEKAKRTFLTNEDERKAFELQSNDLSRLHVDCLCVQNRDVRSLFTIGISFHLYTQTRRKRDGDGFEVGVSHCVSSPGRRNTSSTPLPCQSDFHCLNSHQRRRWSVISASSRTLATPVVEWFASIRRWIEIERRKHASARSDCECLFTLARSCTVDRQRQPTQHGDKHENPFVGHLKRTRYAARTPSTEKSRSCLSLVFCSNLTTTTTTKNRSE